VKIPQKYLTKGVFWRIFRVEIIIVNSNKMKKIASRSILLASTILLCQNLVVLTKLDGAKAYPKITVEGETSAQSPLDLVDFWLEYPAGVKPNLGNCKGPLKVVKKDNQTKVNIGTFGRHLIGRCGLLDAGIKF
jgi:hypothetical protein